MRGVFLLVVFPLLFAMELTTETPFGHNMLQYFLLEKGYVNLNHGSYGAPPRSVVDMEHQWQYRMEGNPDRWFRYEMEGEMEKVRHILASYVNANPKDVVFVLNASHGVNSVLRSLKFLQGEKILYFNIAYPMVKNTLSFLHKEYNQSLIQANITFPTSREHILDVLKQTLDENPDIKLACIDHISSIPAIILPVKEMAEECRKRGVKVLVDGAHVIGQIPLDVTSLGVDFYLSNGHKWLYSPRASAFLWVREEWQPLIFPTVISNEGRGATQFQLAFSWEGTADFSPYLAMSEAIRFRTSLGEKRILEYIHSLAIEGGKLLAALWNTELLVSEEMTGAMVNVQLPNSSHVNMSSLPAKLLEDFHVWVPVYSLQGKWYTRVSAQIYNQIEDFQYLGESILKLLNA